MSQVPLGANVGTAAGTRRPESWTIDLPDQCDAAERIARRRGLGRSDIEVLGVRSQGLAKQAWEDGHFDRAVLPVPAPVVDRDGNTTSQTLVVSRDQGLRDTTAESLATLAPIVAGGIHTAGTASQIFDGAAAVLLLDSDRARALQLRPRARIVSQGARGREPEFHLDGPVQATAKVLEKAGKCPRSCMPFRSYDLNLLLLIFASTNQRPRPGLDSGPPPVPDCRSPE